jgi:LuxR family transcriptional regulator, glucitol operon activator
MAPDNRPPLSVFISSPGDVSEERRLAIEVLQNLEYEPFHEGKIHLKVVAWNKKGSGPLMVAHMTPQEAINLSLPKPSQVDIVIVILWSRMGTPLPDSFEKKEDGTAYRSGTEWEFEDARKAAREKGRPTVLLYRCMERPPVDFHDPGFQEQIKQLGLVDDFFRTFKNPDGSLNTSYQEYQSPGEFKDKLRSDINKLIHAELSKQQPAPTPEPPAHESPYELPFRWYKQFGPLIGREQEQKQIIQALKSPYPLVIIEGMPGVGKTSLALEVAYSLLPQPEEEKPPADLAFNYIVWVSAKGKPKQKKWLIEVLDTIARALDFPSITQNPTEKIEDIKRKVKDLLRTHWTLIIIDNFESIRDRDLEGWIMTVPEPSKVMVTSRRGQLQNSLSKNSKSPINPEGLVPINLVGLADNDALDLIRRHAGTFELDNIKHKPDEELLPLIRNTSGNPLAMVWALGTLRGGLEFEDIIKGLQLNYKNKKINNVIKYVFSEAWKQLSQNARKVLFAVPLFVGADSINKGPLCAASGLSEEAFHEAVVKLVDFKLLKVCYNKKGKPRYKIHPMAYTFARAKLDPKLKLEEDARKRLGQYYLEFVRKNIVREKPHKPYWNVLVSDNMQTIDEEWLNINEILKWAGEQNQDQLFLDLIMLLVHYLDSRFYNLQRITYVKMAIGIAHRLKLREEEALLRLDALGWTLVEEKRLDEAYQEIMLGGSIAEQLTGDGETKNDLLALSYAWQARVRIEQGQSEQVSVLIARALSLACSPWIKFRVYMAAGDIALKQYKNEEALYFYKKQAASMKDYGGEGHGYQVLPRLGLAYVGTGDIESAEEKFKVLRDQENISIGKLYGDYGLALVAYKRNQTGEARRLANETKAALSRKTTSHLLLELLNQLFQEMEGENKSWPAKFRNWKASFQRWKASIHFTLCCIPPCC